MDRDEQEQHTRQSPEHQPPGSQPPAGPGSSQPGEGPGADPQGAPWWNEPHGGPSQWSGHGTPGHPGPGWPSAIPAGAGRAGDAYGAGGPGFAATGGFGDGGAWAAGSGWGWGHPGGWGGPPPAGGDRPPRQAHRWVSAALAGVVAAAAVLVGVGIGYGIWNGGSTPTASSSHVFAPHRQTTSITSSTSSGKTSNASGGPSDTASIAKGVDPDLVDINTVLGYETEEAAGTGMVLTPTGKVLTNNHVIEGSTSISVTDLGNGQTYSATVLGYSRTNDVALIQLKGASGLQTVSLGNSTSVKVGEAVVGIGNAGGVGGTPSVAGGSVTALNQAITASDEGSLGTTTEHLTGLIESNCDIQPGDSGGPLVDSSGKVVGMDTAASEAQGYSISGAATGQGYSIPIDTALSIVKQIESGKATTSVHIGGTAFLGVYVGSTSATRSSPGPGLSGRTPTATPSATSSTSGSSGALVVGVIAGTPAKSSGLATGDVITSIGGQTVTSVNDVTKIVMGYHPGQSVKVTWTTPSGATQSATVALASGPAD